jgi:hypothetical protein
VHKQKIGGLTYKAEEEQQRKQRRRYARIAMNCANAREDDCRYQHDGKGQLEGGRLRESIYIVINEKTDGA